MMRIIVLAMALVFATSTAGLAAARSIQMSTSVSPAELGEKVRFQCVGVGKWKRPLGWSSKRPVFRKAKIWVVDADQNVVVRGANLKQKGRLTYYDYSVPENSDAGEWSFSCLLIDRFGRVITSSGFPVIDPEAPINPPGGGGSGGGGAIAAHNSIQSYDGPSTCIGCHQQEAAQMLDSLHMQWAGPTPKLVNTNGESLGKAKKGINTFCTYAMSSKGACFSCHVRADGNAPHAPEVGDVDCLMCHSDTYQRKFVADPDNTETVTNVLGQTKTYVFGKVDAFGNYTTEPDFSKMPAGTTMVDIARNVHLPTNQSCLRCHATAGGGDWTKRGDMGKNSASATVDQDYHLAKDGANLSCVNCHASTDHKVGGRGIDLRQTELAAPTCQSCHGNSPHSNTTLNDHAKGQVSCQVCHITQFAKGGATEMSRDWRTPVWNSAFCSGQGGFVGEEIKASNVKPDYVWFDGTSYVYNVGETISPDERGIYVMAKAHGSAFDGNSSIVPIKRHGTIMPLHESGKMIPPAIMWMFMTGDFDVAVQKGMEEQGMYGSYSLVEAEAEMLITHGVDPKSKAPSCASCHDGSGSTPDGTRMLPFDQLGYHQVPAAVKNCTLCHEKESLSWQAMHTKHRSENVSCSSCHTAEPTGLVKSQSSLCSSCHERETWRNSDHERHVVSKKIACTKCHTFS